jgi:ferrous iron transport protein B
MIGIPKVTPVSAEADFTIALTGNPNSGKTTIFNQLTKSHHHVGNWPGKTVECERGCYSHAERQFDVIDLPGTYSLAAYSDEESLTRSFLLDESPDLVVIVMDATTLERHLYLAIQILEMGLPAVLALNMSDLADKKGQRIDVDGLSDLLGGVPIVRVAASKGEGIQVLKEVVWRQAQDLGVGADPGTHFLTLDYADEIEKEISELKPQLENANDLTGIFRPRWMALELLANGKQLLDKLNGHKAEAEIRDALKSSQERLKDLLPEGVDLHIADVRFGEVSRLVDTVVVSEDTQQDLWLDRIDRVVTHRFLGVPIFLAIMYLVFRLVVDVSAPYLDWIDEVVSGPLTSWSAAALTFFGAPAWIKGLLVDGVIAGVGGVLVFLPGLVVLFLFIAVLEDSGYLARAAFVMNRFLAFLGLNGKSFVPLILGFGCAVPAIYATRTLDRGRDRLLTALMVPLMSCSARLPVYVLFSMALFGRRADQVIWGLYALGVVAAIAAGWLFSRTVLKTSEPTEFVMELPRYRLPTFKSLWGHVSLRTRDFIEGAGTVILLASIVIWVLLHVPLGATSFEESAFGRASAAIAPVFEPAGFGTWEASASLMSGLVAKEVVVSTMAEIYLGSPAEEAATGAPFGDELLGIGKGFVVATIDAGREVIETLTPGIDVFPANLDAPPRETALSGVLMQVFTPLAGLAFLVYVLLYIPCIATLSVIRSEFGSRWALFSAIFQSGIAWMAAVAVYQIGLLIG